MPPSSLIFTALAHDISVELGGRDNQTSVTRISY